jgi:hypothetical protein
VKYGLVVLVGVIAGCAPHTPHRVTLAGPPRVLRSMSLEVGQRATYIERDHSREIGRLYLSAIAVARCGTWVRAYTTNNRDARTWILCVRDDGTAPQDQLARAMVDDGTPRTVDVANLGAYRGEVEALLSRIVPPALAGSYRREDVTVDAGWFKQTLRVDHAGATTWLHPRVPFGGAVKIADGHGREDVLYEVGDAGDDVERDFLRAHALAREGSFTLLGSYGWFSGTSRRPSGGALGTSGIAAFPVSRHLDVVLRTAALIPSADLSMLNFGAGARWSPFRIETGFASNQLFLQATLDYAALGDSNTTLGRGIGLSTAAGVSMWSRHDWTVTAELDHDLAYLNARHGLTQSVSLGLGLQLAFP